MQTPHADVGLAENVPDAHGVHVEAALFTTPVPTPISVIDPAEQLAQVAVDTFVNVPADHSSAGTHFSLMSGTADRAGNCR
jgi:hypothetical protein